MNCPYHSSSSKTNKKLKVCTLSMTSPHCVLSWHLLLFLWRQDLLHFDQADQVVKSSSWLLEVTCAHKSGIKF